MSIRRSACALLRRAGLPAPCTWKQANLIRKSGVENRWQGLVHRGALVTGGCAHVSHADRDAEITQLDFTVVVQKDVLRLDVSVQDSSGVNKVEGA